MEVNFVSYSRFAAQPSNISELTTSVEEVRLQQGKVERNPAASPMAAPRVSLRRLALKPAGSDQIRLGEPEAPEADPYEGSQSVLSLSRSALRKLNMPVLAELQAHVESSGGTSAETRDLIMGSFSRIRGLSAYLGEINKLTENIYVRSVAASRG